MKRYKFFIINCSIVVALTLTCLLLSSCNDYLDTTNEKTVPAHSELASVNDLRATTANLYTSPWYFFHKQRFIQLGDARANNLYISASASNDNNAQASLNEKKEYASIANAWGSLYNVITQAAYIIDDYAPYCLGMKVCSQQEAYTCIAEARFMRALAYWYLAMYWHDVPIVDNAVTVSETAYPNRFEDVIQYAICEAEYARKWLPVKPYETGRVSKVSAEALLSRLYLTAAAYARGGHNSSDFKSRVLDPFYKNDVEYVSSESIDEFYYAKAAEMARAAIADAPLGGYALMNDYEQIFRVQNNNCSEVLFAIQFVARNTTTGLGNDLQGNYCYDRCLDNSYGQAYSTWAGYDFILNAIERGGLSRTRANIMPNNMTYDYLFHEIDTCSHKGEPWTVTGRSVLPIKKQVVGGPIATGNVAFNGNSGFCTPMLRLSEVYLNLAEAQMGLYDVSETRNLNILQNVNTVRRRAYKSEIEAGTYQGDYGTTASFTLDSLLLERRMEFFMEGMYWTDIVRRSFMGSDHLNHMLDYMNNQLIETEGDPMMGCHRLYQYRYTADADLTRLGSVTLTQRSGEYIIARASRKCVHNVAEGSYCHSTEMGNDDNLWSMIYPPTETTQDPNLLKAPVKYDFSTIISNKSDYE